MNIDEQEIQKFNEMASRWWDPNGDSKPLHDLNPFRMKFIEQHADLFEAKICDVGCGGGILSESLAHRGAAVTGIDMAADLINVANLHQKVSKLTINYQHINVERFVEQQAGVFDIVTCMELLEHVPNPKIFLQSVSALLKPGGKIFLSTLNRSVKGYLQAIIGAEYILKLLPKGTHDYKKFIKPAELDAWLRETGIEIKALQGLKYNPLSKQFAFTKDVSVNYLVYGVKHAD